MNKGISGGDVVKEVESATASFTWRVRVKVHGVPDRPVRYSTTGAMYRPAELILTYTAGAHTTTVSAVTLAQLFASGSIEISDPHMRIFGYHVKKDGTPGLRDTAEDPWREQVPDWAQKIADEITLELTRGACG